MTEGSVCRGAGIPWAGDHVQSDVSIEGNSADRWKSLDEGLFSCSMIPRVFARNIWSVLLCSVWSLCWISMNVVRSRGPEL